MPKRTSRSDGERQAENCSCIFGIPAVHGGSMRGSSRCLHRFGIHCLECYPVLVLRNQLEITDLAAIWDCREIGGVPVRTAGIELGTERVDLGREIAQRIRPEKLQRITVRVG